MNRRSLQLVTWSVLAVGLALALRAGAQTSRTVDDVVVYLGVVPAAIVLEHAPTHEEAKMHGGASAGQVHIMVALFEAKTGQRVTGANVSARVRGARGVDEEKKLESMTIAGAETYGNYFSLNGPGPFKINVRFREAGASRDRETDFIWRPGE